MKKIKYLLVDKKEDGWKINKYFDECEKNEIPYIVVTKSSNFYYYVQVDLIAFDNSKFNQKVIIDGKEQNLFDYLRNKLDDNGMIQFILRDLGICRKSSTTNCLGSTSWGIEVKKEYAEKLANSLYNFYYYRIREFKEILKMYETYFK